MHAVMAMCHFCETHGPRVVVICQPHRPNTSSSDSVTTEDDDDEAEPEPSASTSALPFEGNGTARICGEALSAVEDLDERCEACISLGSRNYLLSSDEATKTSYVSAQVAFSEIVLERIRNACARTLSCELAASADSTLRTPMKSCSSTPSTSSDVINEDKEDGSILFGDGDNGYTLALTFRIPDSKARGLQRLYSLLVVSNDMTLLLRDHDFFISALRAMKDNIINLATKTYTVERKDLINEPQPEKIRRVNRLSHAMLIRRISLDTRRSLQTITGDRNIWTRIHRHMMWTLRSQMLRMGDMILEGVPTQDMLVMMEMDETAIEELELDAPDVQSLTLMQLHNLKVVAQLIAEAPGGLEDLDLLLKHIVTGGQIVVESSNVEAARQILLALSNLLPLGCAKLRGYSETYSHSFKYNLLGCPPNTDIPLSVDDALVLRVDSTAADPTVATSLSECTVRVLRRPTAPTLPAAMPTIATRMRLLLLDQEICDTILESTLRETRESWIAKAKQFYQLRKSNVTADVKLATQLVRAKSQDLLVLLFWQSGLSKAFKSHVIDYLRQLKASSPLSNSVDVRC